MHDVLDTQFFTRLTIDAVDHHIQKVLGVGVWVVDSLLYDLLAELSHLDNVLLPVLFLAIIKLVHEIWTIGAPTRLDDGLLELGHERMAFFGVELIKTVAKCAETDCVKCQA